MEIFKSNSKRREILLPLFEWRYLGLKELKDASGYKGSRVGLQRLLSRLQKDGLVDSFLHLYANRKFYHLTKTTFNNYSDDPWYLNSEIKNHDAIVSTFLYQIRRLDFIESASLNFPSGFYDLSSKRRSVEPDGYFLASRNGVVGKYALEIELNRKNSSVIESKFEGYYYSNDFDAVVYVFNDLTILKAYQNYHRDFLLSFGEKAPSPRIAFCFSDQLGDANFNFIDMIRVNHQSEVTSFGSLFLC